MLRGRRSFAYSNSPHRQYRPAGFEVSGLSQAESARPFTITTADNRGRIAVNGVPTSLDEFRATPYVRTDLRVSRPIKVGDRWTIMPSTRIKTVTGCPGERAVRITEKRYPKTTN
jgi:hypothetical protein